MKRIAGALSVCIILAAALALSASTAGAVTGGNGFYRVMVENTPLGVGVGVYTVMTGPAHPITGALGAQNVLFGAGIPGTSYTTIRSFTTGTDYAQRNSLALGAGAPATLPLEGFVGAGEQAIPIGDPNAPSGFRTIYRPGNVAAAPDNLTIAQEASVVGTDFNTSAFLLKTSITNNGASAVAVGLRYLWDFQIGPNDDGPTFQAKGPDGPVLTSELAHVSPAFTTFEGLDNNDAGACFGMGNSPFPFFGLMGSVNGPAALSPTPPSKLTYLIWSRASGLPGKFSPLVFAQNAFDYTAGGFDAATCLVSEDDTGVAYWWGDNAGNALSIAPGATVSIAAYLFAYLPGHPPTFAATPGQEGPPGDPTCSDTLDNDGDGLVDLDDPDCQTPANEPPDCTHALPSSPLVWPPNHKFKKVTVEGVTDPDGDPIAVTIDGISQDEPLNGAGDGNTCSDGFGTGTPNAFVRAERSGLGDGRVYRLDFTADDGQGGTCTGSVAVCVPHDRSRSRTQCVDGGALFDSTSECARKPHGHGGGRGHGHGNGQH
jgi:hypothetical protein